jgi:ferric-dicitrate binding protein FerR (iron transport regulator)
VDSTPDHIEDLIANYLVGEATPDQVSMIEAWRKESESNRRYFDQLKLIFEQAGSVTSAQHFETDLAWEKLRTKIRVKGEAKIVSLDSRQGDFRWFLRIAAGIVILVMAGFFAYQFFGTSSTPSVQMLADKTVETDTLPDGSSVFLNRQTKIEYQFNKKKKTHTAKLTGEAYFNINHADDKTFIVEASGVFIKDIGTSFNVKAYPDSTTVEVVVEEGEVMFYTEGNPGVYLKANGKGVYDKRTKTFTVSEPDANVTAYKTKFFSFSDNDLAHVVETLNAVYSDKIQINGKIAKCRLTVSFNNESIDEIANIMAETLDLTVKKTGSTIVLDGPGCVEVKP